MRISYNWLKDYVGHGWSPDELADRLTMSGLEVESVDAVGSDFPGIVVGRVLSVSQHPNADRLSVCSVDIGEEFPSQIVCGAPNVAAGQRVPVATVGTTLELPDRKNPDTLVPVKLKKAKIRGEESFGMICAEDELGLGEDHDGIMVLSEDAEIGSPFSGYLESQGVPTSDASIDVSITPNRPDAISHIGVARDVAALGQVELTRPEVEIPSSGGAASEQLSVRIDATEACHRYVGMLVTGVTIGESPAWLKSRLDAVGLRPRNNIVDITNYVMYECGQPLHAFDFDQLAGKEIVVRKTKTDTAFVTLDGKERKLPAGTLMIGDAERDVAIAGVMGGENSEVTSSTSNILIESAYFEPSGIRKTAKRLQLQTDASYRFERGIDPTAQAWAAARAADLLVELAGGTIVDGVVDCHPTPWSPTQVSLRHHRIAQVLGVDVERADAQRLLQAIGFELQPTESGWDITVPPFRPDVAREIDVIEEVARLYGLDKIQEPTHDLTPNLRLPPPKALPPRLHAKDHLAGLGFREICTNSMMRADRAEQFAASELRGGTEVGEIVRTLNPISQEMTSLRPSLLPAALKVLSHNLNHGQPGLRTFEFGTVFDRFSGGKTIIPGYRENEHVLVLAAGSSGTTGWDSRPHSLDIFDVKGVVDSLLATLGATDWGYETVQTGSRLTRYHLIPTLNGKPLGTVGSLAPKIAEEYGIEVEVFFAELNFSTLVRRLAGRGPVQFDAISRFPIVDRDLAVLVEKEQAVGPLLETIRRAGGKLLKRQTVFDLYEGDRVEANRKSVAFSLAFAANRTLKDSEVDRAFGKIVAALNKTHGAELRG